MKYTGRIFSLTAILSVHTAYIIYYYFRDGSIDIMDWLGYPLFFLLAYWTGKQYDKATFFSEKDELTNLYNRRFVINSFGKLVALADRTNSKLFVLLIDCDNFKEINDTFGHQKGDLVLTRISEILTSSTRKSDIVARWGGDEFLIIGYYKDELGLQTVIQRLNQDFKQISVKLNLPVDVSIGTSIYPNDSKDLDELLKIADHHMYENKRDKDNPLIN